MIGRISSAAILFIGLSACASPAMVENMVIQPQALAAPSDPTLANAVCITSVTGGEETNPLWTSEVDDASFKAALKGSLRNSGLLAIDPSSCVYELEANLLGLAQPSFGFDMEVTAHVNYSLLWKSTGDAYLLETVTASHTATVGDAFAGIKRLRLANEGAVRNNIEQFIGGVLEHQPT